MKDIRDKKIISGFIGAVVLLAVLWFISPYIKEVSADAWLTTDAHVIDAYINGCWYCTAPKAPTSIQILLHGRGNFDGGTNFQWDCDNDGVYEGNGAGTKSKIENQYDQVFMIQWYNGSDWAFHAWGGIEYWYERNISCSYNTGGQKTVNIKAQRGGMTATGSVSFNIQDLNFNFSMGIPANGDYHPPINDQTTGATDPGTAAPSNIDVGIGMREEPCSNCYQNDNDYKAFDTRSFTYQVDCNGDGDYSEKSGSSNNSSFYIWPGYPPRWNQATFADNVCNFQKAGYYQIGFKIKDPTGRERTLMQGVYLRSGEPFTINVWPTGETSSAVSYVFSGPQDVKLSLKITGLASINTGSYVTTIDCGNGKTVSGPSANGRDYPENILTADNIGPCNYSKPGVYTVVAKFQENKPASEPYQTKSGEDKTKIIITGESGGIWTVVSPFSLKWDVSRANSCSITGLKDGFFATSLPASGTKAVSNVAVGAYEYKLICSGSGGSTEQIIKVNVVEAL